MRIGYLSYVNPLVAGGGGELVGRELVAAGERRGHQVTVVALWPTPSLPRRVDVDGWIVADVHNVPERQRRLDQRILRRVPASATWRFHRLLRTALDHR